MTDNYDGPTMAREIIKLRAQLAEAQKECERWKDRAEQRGKSLIDAQKERDEARAQVLKWDECWQKDVVRHERDALQAKLAEAQEKCERLQDIREAQVSRFDSLRAKLAQAETQLAAAHEVIKEVEALSRSQESFTVMAGVAVTKAATYLHFLKLNGPATRTPDTPIPPEFEKTFQENWKDCLATDTHASCPCPKAWSARDCMRLQCHKAGMPGAKMFCDCKCHAEKDSALPGPQRGKPCFCPDDPEHCPTHSGTAKANE